MSVMVSRQMGHCWGSCRSSDHNLQTVHRECREGEREREREIKRERERERVCVCVCVNIIRIEGPTWYIMKMSGNV